MVSKACCQPTSCFALQCLTVCNAKQTQTETCVVALPLRLPLLIPCYAEIALEAEAAAAGVGCCCAWCRAGRLGEAAVVPAWAEAVTAVLAGWLMAEAVG